MSYKRILTIQDISCVGQCSMTVAMPILSACGQETCILPTAVLSTHTGGFGKPVVIHLADRCRQMWQHWHQQGITFDAVLIGYLGSLEAIAMVQEMLDVMVAPGGLVILDPVMGDHGKLYSGFDESYVVAMRELCSRADILIPNVTEAALLSGMEYRNIIDIDYVNNIADRIGVNRMVLTGIGFHADQTGIFLKDGSHRCHLAHRRVGGSCHGTGDIFAACFTGALMQGKNMEESIKIAGEFTALAIERTVKAPVHWYGVKFEEALPDLIRWLDL